MGRDAFDRVLDIIKEDPIFVSTGKKPQRSAKHQLMVFLLRVGGRLAQESADVGSVSEGSVYQYCYRVSKALRHRRTARELLYQRQIIVTSCVRRGVVARKRINEYRWKCNGPSQSHPECHDFGGLKRAMTT
jgi:hypothetical protein